ncbi:putative receptor-like protein kinase At4g00960 [Triticum dicoccoides]|uniref:putative receptor-like protein kinase At4g00960 n=1 Tax=Triticum dicoccoides TaxID=85692 RepID=UPI00188EF890|nr:putative receptor-like protein kinase At4g00960 [Triticum dicoccoides]
MMSVLCVKVVGACDLDQSDINSYLSPYVVLAFDGQQFRTTAKKSDVNPVWNEHFYFNVFDPTYLPKLFLEASVHFATTRISAHTISRTVSIPGTSFSRLPDSVIEGYPIKKTVLSSYPRAEPVPSLFSRGEVLRMKVYVADDASIRASHPLLGMDRVISSLDFHVSNNHERQPNDLSSRPYYVPLQCLKDITDNFSDKRIIGQGGFGAVYKGVLENGEMIAVKKIVLQPNSELRQHAEMQFEKEVCHLMTVKHPNIVQCVGYCYEIQKEVAPYNNGKKVFVEKPEMLLCLEYLPTGSLNEYLSDESSGLNWSTRYKIIKGICYGLCHLHGQKVPIIHLDLKPANILLSDAMIAKIADFGLSRLLEQSGTIRTSSRLGTRGYMPPEFFEESAAALSIKSDIFSLGVIIIEIITGRKYPSDVTKPSSSNEFVKVLCNWENRLRRSQSNGNLDINCQEEIKRCIRIGLKCLNPDRNLRPAIRNIIRMLQGTESIDCGISNRARSSAG